MMLGGDPTLSRPADTDMLYSGEQWDSGLQQQYLRARYYQPSAGVFASLDPFAGSTSDPQSLHKYAYCHGDGINEVDPSGRIWGPLANPWVVVALLLLATIAVIGALAYYMAGEDDWRRRFCPLSVPVTVLVVAGTQWHASLQSPTQGMMIRDTLDTCQRIWHALNINISWRLRVSDRDTYRVVRVPSNYDSGGGDIETYVSSEYPTHREPVVFLVDDVVLRNEGNREIYGVANNDEINPGVGGCALGWMDNEPMRPARAGRALGHELGHVFGLGHYMRTRYLMTDGVLGPWESDWTKFRSGDRLVTEDTIKDMHWDR